ncbi:MAG: metallophosphoesterase [Draconibacterium sp.]|nr:metallophosphoesterase [Draconibacterium sp.]
MKTILTEFLLTLIVIFQALPIQSQVDFTASELLGKPTNESITINVVPASDIDQLFYEYGTSPGVYTGQSATTSASGGQPKEIVISGLQPNTKYYYRMKYSTDDGINWVEREEHSFRTQRSPGSNFSFTIISDSHAMYNTQYQNAITNIKNENPDFHLDLGDTYMVDNANSQTTVNNAYLAQREPLYMDGIGHSVPIFLASGNHENEEGWNFDDAFSIATASVKARKLYYPTPVPNDFYSGNEDPLTVLDATTYGDQYREDYYAWTWGDALFVVFDPFHYTITNPYGATAGESNDETVSGDQWNWTLGQQQYNWLKQTLENSNAKYKFMFSHHMVGGTQSYVRGGAVPAHQYEWGGYNADGVTWGWDTKRPGREDDDPIRQLMIDNGVSAFFHGHDHQYAYEVRDDIVYQSLPRPSTGLDFNYYSESNEYTERVLASPGHLKVTVTPGAATVEYITSSNTTGTVQHSYTILPGSSAPTHSLTMAVSPSGSGSILPATGVHIYEENTSVTIKATRNSGYFFDHWEGDVANTNSPETTVTLNSDKTITAIFTATTIKLGDVNNDNTVNSTDALIILSCDAGLNTSFFCPMNRADVNEDGTINSTDALIILSYDVGISIQFPLGIAGYRSDVMSCGGCDFE